MIQMTGTACLLNVLLTIQSPVLSTSRREGPTCSTFVWFDCPPNEIVHADDRVVLGFFSRSVPWRQEFKWIIATVTCAVQCRFMRLREKRHTTVASLRTLNQFIYERPASLHRINLVPFTRCRKSCGIVMSTCHAACRRRHPCWFLAASLSRSTQSRPSISCFLPAISRPGHSCKSQPSVAIHPAFLSSCLLSA